MERGHEDQKTTDVSQGGSPLRVLDVEVAYDEKYRVYYVKSSDIPGLNIEASTFEVFVEIAVDAATDLLTDVNVPTRINFRQAVELISADGR